ncbi:DUF72 domain-containing protein [Myxococcota bacterium]
MQRGPPTQLSLPIRPGEPPDKWHAPPEPGELESLRQRLPPTTQFGTCGWVYPGWEGVVWSGPRTESDLERAGLIEYSEHPLLTTMYLESGPDASASDRELRRYAAQLPPEIHCILQVHPEVTTARFTHRNVSGIANGRGGQFNPHFLDSRFFLNEILHIYQGAFGERLGPFLFTFPPTLGRAGISPEAFAERLEKFLSELPDDLVSAIEVREPEYLTLAYARTLAMYGASHVFTTWPGMPPLEEQARAVPTSPEVMIQVVDPSGRKSRRERLQPFDQIQAADPKMRQAVVDLLQASRGLPTYVLVHNEAEGCAPLTILALARMLLST